MGVETTLQTCLVPSPSSRSLSSPQAPTPNAQQLPQTPSHRMLVASSKAPQATSDTSSRAPPLQPMASFATGVRCTSAAIQPKLPETGTLSTKSQLAILVGQPPDSSARRTDPHAPLAVLCPYAQLTWLETTTRRWSLLPELSPTRPGFCAQGPTRPPIVHLTLANQPTPEL